MSNPISLFLATPFVQKLANSQVSNSTAPTFSGISGVTPNNDGSFTLSWSAATGAFATPVEYDIYVALGSVSASSLFVSGNMVETSQNNATSANVSTLANLTTYFVNGQVYTFGVRAVSSTSISDTNTTIMTATAIASGNLASIFQTI